MKIENFENRKFWKWKFDKFENGKFWKWKFDKFEKGKFWKNSNLRFNLRLLFKVFLLSIFRQIYILKVFVLQHFRFSNLTIFRFSKFEFSNFWIFFISKIFSFWWSNLPDTDNTTSVVWPHNVNIEVNLDFSRADDISVWNRARIFRLDKYPDAVINSTHKLILRFRPSLFYSSIFIAKKSAFWAKIYDRRKI